MRALELQTLSTTATRFQRDGDGGRGGLKIGFSQEGVSSSSTFGTEHSSFLKATRPPRRTPTLRDRPEPLQHSREKCQEPVETGSLTGRFAPEMTRGSAAWLSAILTFPDGSLNRPLSSGASAPRVCFSGLPDALAFGQVVLPGYLFVGGQALRSSRHLLG